MDNRKSKKVGIMGGTFNPVHIGHLLLGEWAKEAAGLDEILFIPTGYSYMKNDTHILPGEERLHMVELAIQNRNDFFCSDIEVKRCGHTYTYETLEQLTSENPNTEYYFIVGSDCLDTIEKWAHPERIFKLCTLLVATRNDVSIDGIKQKADKLHNLYHGKIQLLSFLSIEISSSEIRNRIKNGRSIRYMVPEEVILYIEEKFFYKN